VTQQRPGGGDGLDQRQAALVDLGTALRAAAYEFVTPTPETHRRVNAREGAAEARGLRDIFGWSRPFRRETLPAPLLALCERAQILQPGPRPDTLVSGVRFSTLEAPTGRFMFVHSAYPTTDNGAVFFGPDSYRYAALLARTVWKARRLIDVGCGTGVGGLVLAARAEEVVLADVSPDALRLAAVNVALAGRDASSVTLRVSDVLAGVDGDVDVVVSNPPYLAGPEATSPGSPRLYRDGGGQLGIDLAARIAVDGLQRLGAGRGGQLVLYTGVPIVDGRNLLRDRLEGPLREAASSWTWEELDPDVFGEELERPAYHDVERLAVVALTATVG